MLDACNTVSTKQQSNAQQREKYLSKRKSLDFENK